MDWILEHLQLIMVAAGAIAVWLNNRSADKAGKPADYDGDGVPENRPRGPANDEVREFRPVSRDGADPEQDERVRRIQDEIRRKIAERRGQPAPPLPELAPFNPLRPVFSEEPSAPFEQAAPPPMPPAREIAPTYDDVAALERQKRLAEQLAELETRRREVRRTAQALAETGGAPVSGREKARTASDLTVIGARGLAAELRDPVALRRALVLREVLDAPIALRRA